MTKHSGQHKDHPSGEQEYSPLEPLPIVRIMLLLLVRDEPGSTGYDLIGLIEELTHGHAMIQSGTVYGELRRLEKHGMLTSQREKDGRRRREYQITEQGEQELAMLMAQVRMRTRTVLKPLLSRYYEEDTSE